jgi:DNA invertase Pin-like site-specific DNA recombinase
VKYATERGWIFDMSADVYQDLGKGAWRTGAKRPSFDKMVKACTEGRYNRIVVYRMDRLSRDWTTWGELLGKLPNDFEIHSATEAVNSVTNKFAVQILAAVAEESSDATRSRVTAAKRERIKQGAFVGSLRPYGWDIATVAGRRTLVLNPAESVHLRHVVEMVMDGKSVMDGCRYLREQHQRTTMPDKRDENGDVIPRHAGWSGATLLRLLRSPVLIGCRGSKTTQANKRPPIEFGEDGNPRVVSEPLIDLTTWRQLSARLEQQSTRRASTRTSLLAGIIRCNLCGYAMATGGPSTGSSAVYRCKSRYDRGAISCVGCSISRPRLEQHVSVLALLLLVGSELRPAEADPMEERIAQLQVSMQQVASDLYDPVQAASRTDELRSILQRQLNDYEEQLRAAKRATEKQRPSLPVPSSIADDFRQAAIDAGGDVEQLGTQLYRLESWEQLDIAERRQLIASVIDTVFIRQGNRAATARLPNAERGNIGRRLSVVLATGSGVQMDYGTALEQAAATAALSIAGAFPAVASQR